MMGTEIFKIDASWAEKLTKTRVSFLTAPTVNVCYLVRGGPSNFGFFSRKSVGSRKFFGPMGQKKFLGGKFML